MACPSTVVDWDRRPERLSELAIIQLAHVRNTVNSIKFGIVMKAAMSGIKT